MRNWRIGFQPVSAGGLPARPRLFVRREKQQAGCPLAEPGRMPDFRFEQLFAAEHGVNAMLVAGVAVERQRLLQ